jgi:CRP-like cAMP-binding protein
MKSVAYQRSEAAVEPALLRLARLAPLRDASLRALRSATELSFSCGARSDLVAEGKEISRPMLILEGWAARIRLLEDGRRQVLSLLVPGDLIGNCHQARPLAVSTVTAITNLRLCPAPSTDGLPDLCEVYAISGALEEAYLLANITRLGRLTAHERICDLLLELHERLDMAGLVQDNGFYMPLTQEMLADAAGLTSVHVNRTLQQLRHEGELTWKSRQVVLTDPERLADQIGRNPVRVTAAPVAQPSIAI